MTANLFGGDGLIVIVVALVVLVGGSQLPKIARNVGMAGREFRKAQQEAESEAAAKAATPPPPVPLPATQAPPPPAAAPAAEPAPVEAGITLTPAQLDALLKAREDQVRGDSGTN